MPRPAYLFSLLVALATAPAQADYHPIQPRAQTSTIRLDGRTLSVDEVVQVARYGAKVEFSPEALSNMAGNYGLLLEATAEGIPVYWFNRGSGDQRETVIFEGDALSPANRPIVEKVQEASFRQAALYGVGPEVADEEIVRAMMVVRANSMVHNAPSPALATMLVDLLNRRITPVVRSRGSVGEGDLGPLGNVGGTMIGVGDAYLNGERLPAKEALRRSGLSPLKPFAADDNALTSSNAYAVGQAALLVHDARELLEWTDLSYALALNGMNSSISPLSLPVQRDRPNRWLNWHAQKMLHILGNSYLFEADNDRIIQDPESLRASSIRQASSWMEWQLLEESVTFQINSSDHNPVVARGLGPQDAKELASPQLMHFYVKGGALSHGEHGYILSNANWDPYPFANRLESFTIALDNMAVAVAERIERFRNPFFTKVAVEEALPDYAREDDGYTPIDLLQQISADAVPTPARGSALVGTVEDLQAQTRQKVARARDAVSTARELLAFDLLEGALWMDVRSTQAPGRQFGEASVRLWQAIRRLAPRRRLSAPELRAEPDQSTIARFLTEHSAQEFTTAPLPR
jgi:histidine ammonia-lyase